MGTAPELSDAEVEPSERRCFRWKHELTAKEADGRAAHNPDHLRHKCAAQQHVKALHAAAAWRPARGGDGYSVLRSRVLWGVAGSFQPGRLHPRPATYRDVRRRFDCLPRAPQPARWIPRERI